MDFINDLEPTIQQGFEAFKTYIGQQLERDPNFLEHFFWSEDASQRTVLNYLIHLFQDSGDKDEFLNNPLLPMIQHVVSLMNDKNTGTPLHQAISENKIQLAHSLFVLASELEAQSKNPSLPRAKKVPFNFDQRDSEGRTLLSLVLSTKNDELLKQLLKHRPNLGVPTYFGDAKIPFQPLHQSVHLNYPQAIHLLAQEGVQLANPCGNAQDTPLLLAAHLMKIEALEALLEQPVAQLQLEAKRRLVSGGKETKLTAVEQLCVHLRAGKNKAEVIRGIAMLLCCGAEPPQNDSMRQLLCDHRSALLKAIDSYLKDKPELVDPFVRRCHLRETALHKIVYDNHSWAHSFRNLFGAPSDNALVVENLVVRKYTTSNDAKEVLPSSIAANLSSEKDPVKLYAMFVRRYTTAYSNQFFTNSWSKMRWMIADGQCDWETVERYVQTNPNTRSARIYNDMFKELPKVHDELETTEGIAMAMR